MKVLVEADGGSRGNPGPAGYGSVVWSADRSIVLAESKQSIGLATNNVAEYRGLIAGLEEAAKLHADRSRGVDGFQTRRRADVGAMEGQASRPRRAARPGSRAGAAVRSGQLHVDSASGELARRPVGQRGDGRRGRTGRRPSPAAVGENPSPPGWTGARGAATRLLLLRHGQTELSVQRRYSGRGNPPLTELGRQQADAAARYLAARGGIAAVISSPLQRCHDTATAAAKRLGLDVTVDDDLIETDFGGMGGTHVHRGRRT